jgi:hypothetical protein
MGWDPERLVPWRMDSVKWDKYMEYLCYFFDNHCVRHTLHSASDRVSFSCLCQKHDYWIYISLFIY